LSHPDTLRRAVNEPRRSGATDLNGRSQVSEELGKTRLRHHLVVVTLRHVMAGLLVVAAALWAVVNGPVEGPTLLVFSPGHGLTVGDLPSVGAVITASWLLARRR